MKIDIQKLADLEKRYANEPIVCQTLCNMINMALDNSSQAGMPKISIGQMVSIETLKDLRILVD